METAHTEIYTHGHTLSLHDARPILPPGAEVPLVAAVELGRRRRARAELRHLLGVGAVLAAPRPRKVLPALQAISRRQETPAAGQLFAALHPAGARRGARRGGADAARARHRTQPGHRQPDGVPGPAVTTGLKPAFR